MTSRGAIFLDGVAAGAAGGLSVPTRSTDAATAAATQRAGAAPTAAGNSHTDAAIEQAYRAVRELVELRASDYTHRFTTG